MKYSGIFWIKYNVYMAKHQKKFAYKHPYKKMILVKEIAQHCSNNPLLQSKGQIQLFFFKDWYIFRLIYIFLNIGIAYIKINTKWIIGYRWL